MSIYSTLDWKSRREHKQVIFLHVRHLRRVCEGKDLSSSLVFLIVKRSVEMKPRDSHAQNILVRVESEVCKGIKEKVQGSYTLSAWVYEVPHK